MSDPGPNSAWCRLPGSGHCPWVLCGHRAPWAEQQRWEWSAGTCQGTTRRGPVAWPGCHAWSPDARVNSEPDSCKLFAVSLLASHFVLKNNIFICRVNDSLWLKWLQLPKLENYARGANIQMNILRFTNVALVTADSRIVSEFQAYWVKLHVIKGLSSFCYSLYWSLPGSLSQPIACSIAGTEMQSVIFICLPLDLKWQHSWCLLI